MNLALPQDDMDFINYDSVVAGLECFSTQIGQLKSQVKANGAVDRNQVSMLLSISTESHNLHPNAFTQRPSITGLGVFVASLEAESDSLIRRLYKSLGELLVKIWTGILNFITGGTDKAQKLQQNIEIVEAHAEILSEMPKAPVSPDEEQKFQETMRSYTKLTALSLNDVSFNQGVSNLVVKSTARFEFIELLIKDYVDQVNRGIQNEAQNLTDSEMMKLIRAEVMPALVSLNREMVIHGVDFRPNAIAPSTDANRPDELAALDIVSDNASTLRKTFGDLQSELATIRNPAEMDNMLKNVDRLNEFASSMQKMLKQSQPLSQKVLEQAMGFEHVPPLTDANRQGNKFDEVRLQAEFIKGVTRLFVTVEKIGGAVLSDALTFINSVLVTQSARVKSGLAGMEGTEASVLRRKLAQKLEAIRSKYE